MRFANTLTHAVLLICLAALPAEPAAAVPQPGSPQPKTTLVFWHEWPEYQNFLEEMAARYRLETNIQVNFRLVVSGQDYQRKIQAAAKINSLPDIIGLADNPALLAFYAKNGKLADLTSPMRADNRAWELAFYPRALNALYFPPSNPYGVRGDTIWGVPLSAMNIQIFYNRVLFQKAGLNPDQPPQTWEELMSVCQQLKSAGIAPLIGGFGDLWVSQTFFRTYAWALLGEAKMRNLFLGETPYLIPECQQVMNYFAELRNKGCLYPGASTLSNKQAEVLFAGQKAAMIIDGSWAVNVYTQMDATLDLDVMPFPKLKEARYPMVVIGGLEQGAALSANGKQQQAALDFLRWLTAQPQQERWAREPNGFPALLAAQPSINPKLKPFVLGMNELPPNLFLEERRDVLETMGKG
ncbi:MAG: extracellular solute-binding protein, partial [Candidatus Firestonebacteria bacterium]|nr:extracellular solute-binding protein [Candidatus Firestonebacteria bacterium]